MSNSDKLQADFKSVAQEDNKVEIKEEQRQMDQIQGNQNNKFSCKQFLFGTQKRTALSVCFLVISLLGLVGFIVGMLIVSGDIRIQQHQVVTGFDGKQYNYTNLQVKPEWSLEYDDFIVMQPIVNRARILQEDEIQSDCIFNHSPDGLVTVQTCGGAQNVIVHDEKVDDLASDLNNNPEKVRRILAGDDDPLVDINEQFQQDISIDGQTPQISSQEFVQIDNNGNLVVDIGSNRRILRFKLKKWHKSIVKAIAKNVNITINRTVNVAKNAAPYIGAAIGFVVGGPAGMCVGMNIGSKIQTALQACFPDAKQNNQTPSFKCSAQQFQPPTLVNAAKRKSMSLICSKI